MWLLFGCDEAYARPLAVAVASVLRHLPDDQTVHVTLVHNQLSSDSRRRLHRVIQRARRGTTTEWFDADALDLSGLSALRHLTVATYLRLFIDQVIPAQVDRVLYLDSDVLVRADVSPLYQADLGGRTLGAIRDMAVASLGHPYSGIEDAAARGIADAPYFNAGVLVVDLRRWRALGQGEALRVHARNHPAQQNHDQDALNDVLREDWRPLGLEWNVQGSLLLLHELVPDPWVEDMARRRRQLLDDPAIVHFSGDIKPWKPISTHPYAAEWRRGLARSGWWRPGERLRWAAPFHGRRTVRAGLRAIGRRPVRESLSVPIDIKGSPPQRG